MAPLGKPSEPIRSLNARVTSSFGSPVIGLGAFDRTDRAVGVVIFTDGLKDYLDLVTRRRVVLFERKHVIRALLSNLVGDLFLGVERIERDDASFKDSAKVSCEGMPFFNSRKVLSHSCFAFPNVSISVKNSAPQIVARIAIVMMSINAWSYGEQFAGQANLQSIPKTRTS